MLMITTDGRTLSYDVSGAGAPIVFVAGLGERGTYWMAQVAAFSSAFQVVTFDHRGVGASEGEPPYKVEQWAADTLRLIDDLGLDRVHLVGHSTGGIIAQVLAADHSDRVASLVNLGAAGRTRLQRGDCGRRHASHAPRMPTTPMACSTSPMRHKILPGSHLGFTQPHRWLLFTRDGAAGKERRQI
jgi:pimeloyl-ACP methyl ester carboxylesterase